MNFTQFLVIFSSVLVINMAQCPLDWTGVSLQPRFNFDMFLGKWFEVMYHYAGDMGRMREPIENERIVFIKDGSLGAKVQIFGTQGLTDICVLIDSAGTMRLEGQADNPAKMRFKYSSSGTRDTHFYVVSTDYVTYAIVIECPWVDLTGHNCSSGTRISVLSRQPVLVNEFKVRIVVTEQLCNDFDNVMYEVIHFQECSPSSRPTVLYTTLFFVLTISVLYITSWLPGQMD